MGLIREKQRKRVASLPRPERPRPCVYPGGRVTGLLNVSLLFCAYVVGHLRGEKRKKKRARGFPMEAPFLPAGISVSGSWTNGDETVTATSPSPSTTVVLAAAFVCRVFATGQAGRRPVAVPSPTGTRGWGGGRVSVRRVSLSHGVAVAQRASRRGVSEPPAVRPRRSVTRGSLPPLHRRRT